MTNPKMKNISFTEVKNQVNIIKEKILSDMIFDVDSNEESLRFSRHLYSTKFWFARVSFVNKKKFLLTLLNDVTSNWTLSLLLKSMWNCRPKDAVLSTSQFVPWSCYDQVPLDHNRAAQPVETLALTMTGDRKWFLSLNPESQAMVLSELLTVSGGPILNVVLQKAQKLYERSRESQLLSVQEYTAVAGTSAQDKNAEKADNYLSTWNATVKAMVNSLKLEELEMTLNDGTKKKIWKVNRPRPEAIETVDLIQLLPSEIGKRILSYLSSAQLVDCARVNKYWAFLVDELKAELAARIKINLDLEKLKELMDRYETDESIELINNEADITLMAPMSSIASTTIRKLYQTGVISEKSGRWSFKHLEEKLRKPTEKFKPIRNLKELSEKLARRGAADENLFTWCDNVIRQARRNRKPIDYVNCDDNLMSLHFPCPMLKKHVDVPLQAPLMKDPSVVCSVNRRQSKVSNVCIANSPDDDDKRYHLWGKDFSPLYPVYKIPSHQCPPY